jgi:hypothetical protein
MSRAFVKEDSAPENQDELAQAYLRDRIAQLGGGDYEKGLAHLKRGGVQVDGLDGDAYVPLALRRKDDVLRAARQYAARSGRLSALMKEAIWYRAKLTTLLVSTECSTPESIAEGGRAYGAFMRAVRRVEHYRKSFADKDTPAGRARAN